VQQLLDTRLPYSGRVLVFRVRVCAEVTEHQLVPPPPASHRIQSRAQNTFIASIDFITALESIFRILAN
jgi:hypothetical protein